MNVGIRVEEELDDANLSEQFSLFCVGKKKHFEEADIRRIILLYFISNNFPDILPKVKVWIKYDYFFSLESWCRLVFFKIFTVVFKYIIFLQRFKKNIVSF